MLELERRVCIAFVLPAIVLVIFNSVIPFLTLVNYTLHTVSPGLPKKFVGLINYYKAAPHFTEPMLRSLIFAAVAIAIELPLGITIAHCIPRNRFLLSYISLPILMPYVTTGLTWRMFFRSGGFAEYLLKTLTGINVKFLSKSMALPTTIIMDVWHWTPLVILITAAALASMPQSPLMAAELDGLSRFTTFRKVTWNYIRHAVLLVFLIRLIDAIKIFDEPWIAFSGPGPGLSAEFISTKIVRLSIQQYLFHYGSVLSVDVLILDIIICFILLKLLMR